jgi:hypothetical protein
MDEEQAVLDFFSQPENLPLALAVAEQVDDIRRNMNNDFWRELAKLSEHHAQAWNVRLTEDRNTNDCLVGLYLQPLQEQPACLLPMLEQQVMGTSLRIYAGLIWSNPPTPDQSSLPEVMALRDALQHRGFQTNEKFLAWQWTPYFPRSKSFLMRFSTAAEALLDEAGNMLRQMDTPLLAEANAALGRAAQKSVISLETLRNNLKPTIIQPGRAPNQD